MHFLVNVTLRELVSRSEPPLNCWSCFNRSILQHLRSTVLPDATPAHAQANAFCASQAPPSTRLGSRTASPAMRAGRPLAATGLPFARLARSLVPRQKNRGRPCAVCCAAHPQRGACLPVKKKHAAGPGGFNCPLLIRCVNWRSWANSAQATRPRAWTAKRAASRATDRTSQPARHAKLEGDVVSDSRIGSRSRGICH